MYYPCCPFSSILLVAVASVSLLGRDLAVLKCVLCSRVVLPLFLRKYFNSSLPRAPNNDLNNTQTQSISWVLVPELSKQVIFS
jgi:hypothetical protein